MNPHDELLELVRSALAGGLISADELVGLTVDASLKAGTPDTAPAPVTTAQPTPTPAAPAATGSIVLSMTPPSSSTPTPVAPVSANRKLNVVDVLFYLAGLVTVIAFCVFAGQSGGGVGSIIALLVLPGLIFWSLGYILGRAKQANELRGGVVNALILSGSLSLSIGVFAVVARSVDGSTYAELIVAAVAFVLGLAHVLFDRLFRHIVLILFGVLQLVSSFPLFVGYFLAKMQPQSPDAWVLLTIGTCSLLAYAGLLASRTAPERHDLRQPLASVSVFIAIGAVYSAGFFGPLAVMWQLLLPLTIYVLFYVSIRQRNKLFLATGSLYLVTFLVTAAFRYFSGAGIGVSLLFSAFSIMATAFMAVYINKRYIKVATAVAVPVAAPTNTPSQPPTNPSPTPPAN